MHFTRKISLFLSKTKFEEMLLRFYEFLYFFLIRLRQGNIYRY